MPRRQRISPKKRSCRYFARSRPFVDDSAFSTWLHRIAVNTVLMRLRKKSVRQVSLDEPYGGRDGATLAREYGMQDARLAGCVDRVALASAISALPPGCRTMFLMHEIEGYEHQEIAEMLGCSVGNSKSQLHKARLRIRELLAHSQDIEVPSDPSRRVDQQTRKTPA